MSKYLNEVYKRRFKDNLKEDFSKDSDKWFDLISNEANLNPKIKKLAMDIKDGKIKPTQQGFDKFYKELQLLPSNLMIVLDEFIDDVESGKYDSEFKNKYGKNSQVSEIMSLFRQAVLYNESYKSKGLNKRKFKERKKVSTQYEVMEAIKKALEYNYDELSSDFELYPYKSNEALSEVPSDFAPGFIPYTDGGFQVTGYLGVSQVWSSGNVPRPKEAQKNIDRIIDYNLEYAKESFMDEYPDIVEELGEDMINYHDLYDKGYGNEAEELSEYEMDFLSEDEIQFQLGIFYYTSDNHRGEYEGEYDSVYIYGIINWESPYFRGGKGNEWVAKNSGSIPIDPDSKTFKKDLANKLRKIVSEF